MSQEIEPSWRHIVLSIAARMSDDRADSQAIAGRAVQMLDWIAAAGCSDGARARFEALDQRDTDLGVLRQGASWQPDGDVAAFLAGAEAYLPVLEGAA